MLVPPCPAARSARAATLVFALLVAGCGSPGTNEPTPADRAAPIAGASIDLLRGGEADEIARLEAARSDGDGRLLELLAHDDAAVRRRAAVALGRLPYPAFGDEVTEALCRALEDPEVYLEAAFALGMRADPASGRLVAAYLNHTDAALRARIVEAASRIPDGTVHAAVLLSLRDADLGVRIEAAVATARWDTGAANAPDVDRALIDALRPYTIAPQHTARTAPEAELVWRILYALSRRGRALGRGAFLEYAASDVPLERLFAVRGLARMEPDAEVVEAARAALESELARSAKGSADWRVAYEATRALEAFEKRATLPTLLAAIADDNVHVRASALAALAAFPDDSEETLPILRRGLADLSVGVRNASLVSTVALVSNEQAVQLLGRFVQDEDPILRKGVVAATEHLVPKDAVRILSALASDPHTLVSIDAVQALGKHMLPAVRLVLHDYLGHADNGMRLAAVMALREEPDDTDVPFLIGAFRTSEGDIATEVAFNVLENLGQTPTAAGARELVQEALQDPRPFVREVAAKVLAEDFGVGTGRAGAGAAEGEHPWVPSSELGWERNPLVEVSTTRGNMLFELFPAEAPVHVWSFLQLAAGGEYTDLIFHRVVPDFVVQGGDYRGDGNGGRPFEGESLRHEFGPRKYVRGSLGMPRNQNLDSGGSQIFVTHRPTPHLDGRYTIFGELRLGGEVLDRLELGDRILAVRILP